MQQHQLVAGAVWCVLLLALLPAESDAQGRYHIFLLKTSDSGGAGHIIMTPLILRMLGAF